MVMVAFFPLWWQFINELRSKHCLYAIDYHKEITLKHTQIKQCNLTMHCNLTSANMCPYCMSPQQSFVYMGMVAMTTTRALTRSSIYMLPSWYPPTLLMLCPRLKGTCPNKIHCLNGDPVHVTLVEDGPNWYPCRTWCVISLATKGGRDNTLLVIGAQCQHGYCWWSLIAFQAMGIAIGNRKGELHIWHIWCIAQCSFHFTVPWCGLSTCCLSSWSMV